MVPIYVEHWGDNLQFYPNFALISTSGLRLDHYCFDLKTKKRSSPKIETFLSAKSSDDQKKRSSPKIEEYLSPTSSEDQKKIQRSFSAQMQTTVKLLGGMQIQTIVKLLGGCSQIVGGLYRPHPPLSPPPGFGNPDCSSHCRQNNLLKV